MRSIDYLEALREKKGESYYAVAKTLGVTDTAIAHYKHGRRVMDDYTAAKIADELGIDPLAVIAAANADRETNPEKKSYWEKIAEEMALVARGGIEPSTRGFSVRCSTN